MSENKWLLLLIEDDEEDQWLVKKSFSVSETVELKIVANGAEALDYLRDESQPTPDLILLDLNMPVMDGPTFMGILKEDKDLPKTPTIILTTSDQHEHVQQAYDLGAAAYMVKPPSLEEFKDLARRLEDFWCKCVKLPDRKHKG